MGPNNVATCCLLRIGLGPRESSFNGLMYTCGGGGKIMWVGGTIVEEGGTKVAQVYLDCNLQGAKQSGLTLEQTFNCTIRFALGGKIHGYLKQVM